MMNKLLRPVAGLLCLCVLCAPLLGAATLNVSAGEQPDEPPACICEARCTAEAVNGDCPVCSADFNDCQAPEAEPEPVCSCEVRCTAEAVNGDCPVCSADFNNCQAPEAEPEPVCSCKVRCAEGAVDESCPVCATGFGACQGPEPEPVCICDVKCAAGAVNTDCPVCKLDLDGCQGAEAPAPLEPKFTISIPAPSGWYTKSAYVEVSVTDVNGTGWESVQARVDRNGSWQDLTDDLAYGGPVYLEITENCTVYVTVTDRDGKTHNKSRYIECFDREAPTVRAGIDGRMLRVEGTDALSGVEYIYINGYQVSDLTNGTADVRLRDYADSTYEQISVYAVDYAGNKSKTVQVKNPDYQDPADQKEDKEETPSGSGTTECPTSTPTTTPSPSTGTSGSSTSVSKPSAGNSTAPSASQAGEPETDREPVPFTPDGTGTVVDNATGEDGKEFFTITTPSENTFYLIVDRQREENNVYFLGAVTEEDLLALAAPSEDGAEEQPDEPDPAPTVTPEPDPEPEPSEVEEPAPEPEKKGGFGTVLLILLVVAGAGGAGYYLKVYKPKHDLDDAEDLDAFPFEEGPEAAGEPATEEPEPTAPVTEATGPELPAGDWAAADGLPEEEYDGEEDGLNRGYEE